MVPYSLDTLLSAAEYHFRKWSPRLIRSQTWPILRQLIYGMWHETGGQIHKARFTYAQASLSIKLHLNKKWINVLCQRLVRAGWLEYETIKLPDGTNSSCKWRIGGKLKRLMVSLCKSGQRKSPTNYALVNSPITVPSSSEEDEKKKPSWHAGGQGTGGVSHPEKGGQGRKWWGGGRKETGREARARLEAEEAAEVQKWEEEQRRKGGPIFSMS